MRNRIAGMFGTTPTVVKNLLIINVMVYIAYMIIGSRLDGKTLNDLFGLHYIGADNFKPIQFLTYMFLHANHTHIIFNMFGLWMFGRTLESVWGSKRFLIYYFVTGIGAALIQMLALSFELSPVLDAIDSFLANPDIVSLKEFLDSENFKIVSYDIQNNFEAFRRSYNNIYVSNPEEAMLLAEEFIAQYRVDFLNAQNMVGASGAVFGILLGFGMLFPNTQLYIIPLPFPIKAKWIVMAYGAFELYQAWMIQPGDHVAHVAHLGGMIFGFILIKIWGKDKKKFF